MSTENDKLNKNTPPPVEENYPAHDQDPGPAPEAVYEEDKDGAGSVMKWIIPAILVILAIAWLIMR